MTATWQCEYCNCVLDKRTAKANEWARIKIEVGDSEYVLHYCSECYPYYVSGIKRGRFECGLRRR